MAELEDSREIEEVLKSQEPVAIFFYMNGCPHCENMKTPWSNISKKHKGVRFVKIEASNTPSHLGITGYPQFAIIEKGKQKKSVGGEMKEAELDSKLFGTAGGMRTRKLRNRRLRAGRLRRGTRKTH